MGAVVPGWRRDRRSNLTVKKLTKKKKRDVLDPIIREQALGYGLGWVGHTELDEMGYERGASVSDASEPVQAVDTLGGSV